jgi:UDP-glucose 4-epimerase
MNMKNTYIVTGGAGFIGSHLSQRLINSGHNVIVLDDLSTGFERNLPDAVTFYKVDISDMAQLMSVHIPGKVHAIYHLAAQSSGEASFNDPARDIEVNYRATYNILKLGELNNINRFIYTSSMSVYGEVTSSNCRIDEEHSCRPISYYGCNKLSSENLIRVFSNHSNICPTVLRLFNVYGPGQNMFNIKQGMVSIYLSYLIHNKPIHVKGSLDRFRDFVYVDDVVDILVLCESNIATFNQVFNVGTGTGTTVSELLRIILKTFSKDDFDTWIRVEGNTPGDIKGCVANNEKVCQTLHWEPQKSIEYGIAEMKSWLDKTKEIWN